MFEVCVMRLAWTSGTGTGINTEQNNVISS